MSTVVRLGDGDIGERPDHPGDPAALRAPRRRSNRLLLAGLLGALAVLAVACLLSIAIGSRSIPVSATWRLLWHNDGSDQAKIIHSLRIPRTLLGLLVGVALGLSGVVMQALTLEPARRARDCSVSTSALQPRS